MSLKTFHLVFIAASTLLAFCFAAWAMQDYADKRLFVDLVYAAGSLVAGAALIRYSKFVLKKLKHIGYL
jgi:hypothetical protein